MSVFSTLLKKEFLDMYRSKKVIWLPIVFMIMAVMQPITLYYMEDILKMSGSMPAGTVLQIPTPTSEEVMGSVLSQLNTIGVLIIIVATMGAISDERKNGSLTFLLVRPVSTLKIVSSKTFSNGVLAVFSFICSYLLAYYYTVILFSSVSFELVLKSMLVYCLYLLFIVGCVIFCSATLNSNGTIAIVSILFFSALSIVSGWFSDALKWSPTMLSTYAQNIMEGSGVEGLLGSIIVTVVMMTLLHVAAGKAVERRSVD